MIADARWKPLTWIVRVVLALSILTGLVFDLEQLEGKGWAERAVFYALVMLVLPVVWRLSKKRFAYSYLADAFLVTPFALDLLGNLFGLYDSVGATDDVLHAVNWFFLVGAFVLTIGRSSTHLSKLNLVALGTGFGAFMIILWELVEFIVMKLGTERLFLTYEDTIGDLVLSTSGGLVGALVVAIVIRRTKGTSG
jgi:glycopeptide antibiotics resistance protein